MTSFSKVLFVPLAFFALACRGNDSRKVDDALNNDLSIAGHASTPMDSLSAAERTGTATTPHSAPATRVHRSSSRESYSSNSSGESYGTSGTARSAPATHVEKNTGRDAAIGAAAGGVLGAVTSKNKVKGGIIGAAAGGLLGAVIGNNVDKKRVPNN